MFEDESHKHLLAELFGMQVIDIPPEMTSDLDAFDYFINQPTQLDANRLNVLKAVRELAVNHPEIPLLAIAEIVVNARLETLEMRIDVENFPEQVDLHYENDVMHIILMASDTILDTREVPFTE